MRITQILVVAAILLAIALGLFLFFTELIPPGAIGVKQYAWGGGGFDEQDYVAGYHFCVSGYHKWHLLDRRTHFLHFLPNTDLAGKDDQCYPPLDIRTKDNNTVTIDATVPYRIVASEGWMIVRDGLKISYKDRVKSTIEGVLRSEFANMTSEDLLDTKKRLLNIEMTMPKLVAELKTFHVVPGTILIRSVGFPPDYEDKLTKKQIIEQQGLLEEANTQQANMQRETQTIDRQTEAMRKQKDKEWDKKIQEKKSEYEVTIAKINADILRYELQVKAEADADYEKLTAEGRLALDKAEALRTELRNAALNRKGGRILIARDAAENLNLKKVVLNANDPSVPKVLDLDAMVKLLVGEGE